MTEPRKRKPRSRVTDLARQQATKLGKIDAHHTLHFIATRDAGSPDKFIEFLSYCVPDEEGKIGQLIYEWKNRTRRNAILDEIVIRMGLEAGRVYGWAAEGAYRYMNQAKNFRLARAMNGVLDTHVRVAKTAEGYQDRVLFARMGGLAPVGGGTSVKVEQTNVNSAQAKAEAGDPGSSLPPFERERQGIADMVRADD